MDMLRHLRFFVAVAEARHFGDAARGLGMTQPPLSQGVRRLEGAIGVRLFDRDARGVRITPAGQSLLPAARDLLRLEADLLERARGLAVPDQIRLGVAADLEDLVPDVAAALAEVDTLVTPTVAGSVELVDLLRDGALDLAVVRHPGVLDGLDAGEVRTLVTRLVGADGPATLDARTPPVVTAPRHHQPPAHDQFVDALLRAGHSGEILEASDLAQRQALTAARRVVRVVPVRPGEPGTPGSPSLRVRVALPRSAQRRPEVDHEAAAARLTQALGP